MNKIIFILSISVFFLFSCAKEKGMKEIKLQNFDQSYTLVKPGDGKKLNPGDISLFTMIIRGDNGKILLEKSSEDDYGKFVVPDNTTANTPGGPVDEMLSMLVKGDSATLVYQLDSMAKLNPNLLDIENITYEVCIKETYTPAEFEVRKQEKMKDQQEMVEKAKLVGEKAGEKVLQYLDEYKNNTLGDKLIKTESGLEYVVDVQGDGAKPTSGQKVDVHYYGVLFSDGNMFDNSYSRGKPFSFSVDQGQVIKGWDEALLLMNKGTSAVFFIPYELAYGMAGRPPQIPEKSMLVFYIDYL